jgi:DNA end-binding protein Ku
MQELLYADEVRDMADVPRADAELKEQEVKLALQVIDQAAHETFDPSKYKDERREQIQLMIADKVSGQAMRVTPKPTVPSQPDNVLDLVAVLEASLKRKTSGPPKAPKRADGDEAPATPKSTKRPSSKKAKG